MFLPNIIKYSIPNQQKRALIYTQYCVPAVLAIKEVLTPVLTDNEVLIKVHAIKRDKYVKKHNCAKSAPNWHGKQ